MLGRKGASQAGLVVGIIAILLFGVLIYASVPSSDNKETTTNILNLDKTTILDASPGELKVASKTAAFPIVMNHTGVEIKGIPEIKETELASETTVSSTVFSRQKFENSITPDNQTVRGKFYFNILEKKGSGNINVYIAGEKIFSGEPDTGKHIEIPLTTDQFTNGMENKIEISVDKPFFLAFWKTNSYKLEGVFFDSHVFHPEWAKKEIDIPISENQVIGLTAADLDAKVTKNQKAESKSMYISFGGETIYNNTPGAVGSTIEENLPLHVFATGNNTITFGTELDGAYLIDFTITLKILNMSAESYEVYDKNIADDLWVKITGNESYECQLYLSRKSGSDSVVVWINEHRQELAFDTNDEITQDVCGFLNKGKNTIILIAEDSDTSDADFIDIEEISLIVGKVR